MTDEVCKVWCLLIDHKKEATFGDAFPVCITSDADIHALKEMVKKERPVALKDIEAASLTVWRCADQKLLSNSKKDKLEKELSGVNFTDASSAERLGAAEEIKALELSRYEILLIEVPAPEGQKDKKSSGEARDTLSELPIKCRNETLSKFSESMSIDNFGGIQVAHERLFTGRLDDRYAHPVALFHQDLALLQQRLQTLEGQVKTGRDWVDSRTTMGRPEQPTELDANLLYIAEKYFVDSRRVYKTEGLHWTEIKSFFQGIFGTKDMEVEKRSRPKDESGGTPSTNSSKRGSKGKGSTSRGVNIVDAAWGNYVVLEDKNAAGLAGDASLQAAVWYGKHCDSIKERFKHSKLPAILIGVMGNVLEVSIAVCLEEVIVDKILHFEVLHSHHHDETIVKLALIASALKTCAGKLRAEYHDLEKASTSGGVEKGTWHLPCPSVIAPSPNSVISDVKFRAKLNRRNQPLTDPKRENWEMRPLFLATYHDQEVIVKFSVSYNVDAHHALADQKYAPKLYACEQVMGGLKMVVMERVDGMRMDDRPKKGLPAHVFENLEKALKIIHDKGLVFGDLRDTNVMIAGSNGEEVKLVDFDWADKDQEGRYPAMINTDLIGSELASDVRRHGLMCKRHDLYALSNLISTYCEEGAYEKAKCEQLRKL